MVRAAVGVDGVVSITDLIVESVHKQNVFMGAISGLRRSSFHQRYVLHETLLANNTFANNQHTNNTLRKRIRENKYREHVFANQLLRTIFARSVMKNKTGEYNFAKKDLRERNHD
jgi:hypothetical protein